MALLRVSGVFGYGMGATMMGKYGTSLGFTLFMATSILSSNALGLLAGESGMGLLRRPAGGWRWA